MIRGGGPGDSLAMGRVYCEAWKAGYDGVVPWEFLDKLTPEMAAPPAERISPENSFVYEADGVIAGLVNFGSSRDDGAAEAGEIRSIYVLPGHWRRGIGRGLFEAAVGALKEAGYRTVFLWVLTENARARSFYERMGMKISGDRVTEIAGKSLSETRYEMNI